MKVLVFGKTGQLARCIDDKVKQHDNFRADEMEVIFMSRAEADFCSPQQLINAITTYQPDAVINAVAYTAVDKAEDDQDTAYKVNAEAPGLIAQACLACNNIPLIHVSTDFVFDGTATDPYTPDDTANPINVYGASKRAGETNIVASGARYAILRTSWVFSKYGNNFVKTMLRLAEDRDVLTIVEDQVGQPTAASDLADTVLMIAEKMVKQPELPGGIFHYSGQGKISWADFAREIFRLANIEVAVSGIPTSGYPTAAQRPAYSVMDSEETRLAFGVDLPDWRVALAQTVKEVQAGTK